MFWSKIQVSEGETALCKVL